jgi:uncharacterized protein YxeA
MAMKKILFFILYIGIAIVGRIYVWKREHFK